MKAVGIFRELGVDLPATVPSIFPSAGALDRATATDLAAYLDAGVPVFDVMEVTFDPFDHANTIAGGSSLVSDGIWVWRNDLAFLVGRYRIALPHEFVEHALSRPQPVERGAVAAAWQEALGAYDAAERGIV